jgi:phage tail-like protein
MAKLTSKAAIPKGRFRIRADDMPEISFKNAEGLKIEVTQSKNYDGTDQEAMIKLGKTVYDNLVLTAGESAESVQPWWNWLMACAEASENGGLSGEDLMKTIDVICENDDGSTALTVRNSGCLITSMELDSRDGDSADVAVDKMEMGVTRRRLIFGSASG